MDAGFIIALDLAIRTGYALGVSGSEPAAVIAGAVTLKDPKDDRRVAFGNLLEWLNTRCNQYKPALIVKEAPLNVTFQARTNSQATTRLTLGLHAIVEGIAQRHGIPCRDINDQTVRKHFIGKAKAGSREETKLAVIRRAEVLGYAPRGLNDADRSDACAIWDWAAHTAPKELFLFGEAA